MDGLKRRMRDSLQLKLSLRLSLAILSVALIAGLFAFYSAFDEAHELQDDVLQQVAALFNRRPLTAPQDNDVDRQSDSDPESRVFVQWLSTTPSGGASLDGRRGRPSLTLPPNLADGLQTVTTGDGRYRVLVRTLGGGERLAVAQATAVRDEVARDSALRTLMPFLILVPILLVVVADMIRKIFKPVTKLAIGIDRRGEQELQPIGTETGELLPAEIRPFVAAINRLLARVEQAMNAQRRFIAAAAHELRSPLTALSLQAERLAEADMAVDAQARLHTLRQGIERGRTLLDQLLALARAQEPAALPHAAVSVQQIYRRVLEDLMPLAEAKGIDIGVVGERDAHVPISEVDLIVLVKNLVDNAIRYAPHGGLVDLSVAVGNGVTTLTIDDTGPGIPALERERVFDPFHRILGSDATGSGLGLSIVQTIAARVGAQVSLGAADELSGSGLRVTVIFPYA